MNRFEVVWAGGVLWTRRGDVAEHAARALGGVVIDHEKPARHAA